MATLCHGSSFWTDLYGITCCHMSRFSRRKSALKVLVVVTTRFWLNDLDTVATTGPRMPLSENALLNAFLMVKGEKSALVLATDLIRTSRFWGGGFDGLGFCGLFFFSISVQSWGLADLVAPCEAMLANEGVVLGLEAVVLEAVVLVILGGVPVVGGILVSALALFSICLVAVSRLAICNAIIEEADCILPFSVYSLKISSRLRSFVCSSCDFERV